MFPLPGGTNEASATVYPHIRDRYGNDISNIFENPLTVDYDFIKHKDLRSRRSIVNTEADPEFDLDLEEADLHLTIHHLQEVTSPLSTLEWLEQNVTVSSMIRNGCMFSGHVKNISESFGVINLCNGIVSTEFDFS